MASSWTAAMVALSPTAMKNNGLTALPHVCRMAYLAMKLPGADITKHAMNCLSTKASPLCGTMTAVDCSGRMNNGKWFLFLSQSKSWWIGTWACLWWFTKHKTMSVTKHVDKIRREKFRLVLTHLSAFLRKLTGLDWLITGKVFSSTEKAGENNGIDSLKFLIAVWLHSHFVLFSDWLHMLNRLINSTLINRKWKQKFYKICYPMWCYRNYDVEDYLESDWNLMRLPHLLFCLWTTNCIAALTLTLLKS